ncbi:DUF2252 domain-containing protein [Streptomyces fuscigenes]|uniref:DUF2252 domain-containing protein n=1 Tax=Streptomyces fuscigenes TaxID=1528880 RepID=UPI001F202EE1|nr:DUF2252 domain-containing protein [Streptomyces fuscigenes]MCF3961576.1 DUF2252 domain-containing protein [Streptomyces fuscigenes]
MDGTDEKAVEATPRERAERGRAARKAAPRSAHAAFHPAAHRPDPLDVLEEQSATRAQDLVPVRYARMAESPFRFYRGAAALMAMDLAGTPDTGLAVQLCGDAHLLNFRLLASPERRLVFDINDFDETLPGPWEWDVKRLAASLVLAGRENGFDDAERAAVVRTAVASYRTRMRYFAGLGNLDVWYAHGEVEDIAALADRRLGTRGAHQVSRALTKARGRDNLTAYEKLTERVDGERRFVADPPLVVPLADFVRDAERDGVERLLRGLVSGYARSLPPDRRHLLRQYRVVDMARKAVGVGSVGTRCWVVLLLGRDDGDPLILQAKEADRSVLEAYTGESRYDNQGHRVVAGQRLMQAFGDIFLGWDRATGFDGKRRDFYVRQLHDWKGIARPADMEPRGLRAFGQVCGATLARAHARSGDRIAIAAYLGRGDVFDRAVAAFAELYADRTEEDHRALVKAVRDGRLPAADAA